MTKTHFSIHSVGGSFVVFGDCDPAGFFHTGVYIRTYPGADVEIGGVPKSYKPNSSEKPQILDMDELKRAVSSLNDTAKGILFEKIRESLTQIPSSVSSEYQEKVEKTDWMNDLNALMKLETIRENGKLALV